MTSEYLSSDFNYKKYSLEQLDNWLQDAINCEDLTPQDIYNTIVSCVDHNIEYHKKHLEKNIELLSLLKGNDLIDFDYTSTGEKFSSVTEATEKDWIDFWKEPNHSEDNYNKEQVREFEMKERDYERKSAQLNVDCVKELEEIRKDGGYEWTPGT